ncbi:MAG: hypothetical protein KF773_35075 [Deltaproteobacteria bacterium]|nr:hypothetical protein [Deltaproteobacteria bacterium]MCW5807275.1 hypothetical protein [Deltaproteobacteria bacterium]
MLDRLRRKNLHTWVRDYGRHLVRRARAPRAREPGHLLFALCDHYEPLWGGAPVDVGEARVDAWAERYPALGEFRDSDGRPPRHGWFFPGEEYRPHFLDRLARLARAGFGEVEFHLHHDGDTAATLAPRISEHLQTFSNHGHMSKVGDQFRWAFIHGNWSLANGRPDGRWCGVDDELVMLHELGCYVDLTFPSAPDPCQPDKVNQIYWPTGDLTKRRAYEQGERAAVGTHHDDRLLMITGPLALARKGLGVRLENGAITGDDPPTAARVATWVDQGIHVDGRPEWVFVKVHTHGAIEKTAASLLGPGARALHEALRGYMHRGWKLHYVTAREMFNVARAAMAGRTGDPSAYFDYIVPPPPIAKA